MCKKQSPLFVIPPPPLAHSRWPPHLLFQLETAGLALVEVFCLQSIFDAIKSGGTSRAPNAARRQCLVGAVCWVAQKAGIRNPAMGTAQCGVPEFVKKPAGKNNLEN